MMAGPRAGDMTTVAEVRDDDARATRDEQPDPRRCPRPGRSLGTVVALLDVELGDLDAALEAASSGLRRSPGRPRTCRSSPVLGVAAARLAAARDRCEDAAELLGAAARVRGIEDPTDPTVAELRRRSRRRLGDDAFAAAYERGWSLTSRTRRRGSTPRHWT